MGCLCFVATGKGGYLSSLGRFQRIGRSLQVVWSQAVMLVLAEHLAGQPDLLHDSRDSGLAMHITLGFGAVN